MTKPSRAGTWLVLAVGFYAGVLAGISPLHDTDFFWHLKTGEHIVREGALPHADPFSHTRPGAPWVTHEWGYQVLLYLVWAAGGWLGVIYFKALLYGLVALLGLWLCLRWGAGLLPALAAVVLLVAGVSPWINARPLMLQVLFVLLLLHLLTSFEHGRPRALWGLPLLLLVWVNTHGSFAFGWALLALFAVCRVLQPASGDLRRCWPRPRLSAARPLLLPGLASVAVCLLNPSLLDGFLYPFTYIVGENAYHARVITEYASPSFHRLPMQLLLGMMLLTFVSLVLSPQSPRLFELALALGGTALFLKWGRNGPLMAAMLLPVLALHLSARLQSSRLAPLAAPRLTWQQAHPAAVALSVAVLLTTLVFLVPRDPSPDRTINHSALPRGAVEWAQREGVQGNLFNAYHWGGYLLWTLWPEHRVFVDGRADVYGRSLLRDYQRVIRPEPGWREVLDRYQIEWVLLRAESPLALLLSEDPAWAEVYRDRVAGLLVRREGPNRHLAAQATPALP